MAAPRKARKVSDDAAAPVAKGPYDVILVGAGPAGLAVGSELARGLNVLVIDRKTDVTDTQKFWFVPKFTVSPAATRELKPFLYEGVRRFLCDTFTGVHTAWPAHLPGGYWYVKEHEILGHWAGQVRNRGSDVLPGCTFHGHEVRKDGVVVHTDRGDFHARLMVDASGYDSHLRRGYGIKPVDYWWSVYGAVVKHPNGLAPGQQVGDYLLWGTFADTNVRKDASLQDRRPVFEYEILDQDTSFPLILYLRKGRVPVADMKAEFEHVLRDEPATCPFHDTKIVERKWGYYPSGGISQRVARDRVAFIGDAGCWSTPCGWGMGFILQNYQQYAHRLSTACQADTLDRASLEAIPVLTPHSQQQMKVNQVAARFLSNAPAPLLDKFIRFFELPAVQRPGKPGSLMCERVFTLTVEDDELVFFLKRFLAAFGKDLAADVLHSIRTGHDPLFPGHEILDLLDAAVRTVADDVQEKLHERIPSVPRPNRVHDSGFRFE
jgi:flavin-dependent dehydrogenase